MTQSLFLEPEQYAEKLAAETELPEDPNAWPTEILQELYKQVPYVADFEPHVEMDRVEAEKGYGFGHIQISNKTEAQAGAPAAQMQAAGIREIRVPVVIREGKLQPFDILVTDDSKMLPLTEARLRQAIFRPQAFDVTARTPGDMSMIGQLYPPYRQNYGFGGGGVAMDAGMGKQSSALEQWLEKDAAFAPALDEYVSTEGVRHGRLGKKASCETARAGALTEFVEKNAAIDLTKSIQAMKAKQLAGAPKGDIFQALKSIKKVKTGSVLEAVMPTINVSDYLAFTDSLREPAMQAAFMKNASATGRAIKLLLECEPVSISKSASGLAGAIRPSVVQVTRVGDGSYAVKTASHRFWSPSIRLLGRGDVVAEFGEKVALAADTEGAVTMAEGPGVSEQGDADMQKAGPITEYGAYKVQDDQGREHVGVVIPNLMDVDGVELPISLFTNGSVAAVQTDVAGVPAGDVYDLPTADAPSGKGFFFKQQGAGMAATIPLTVQASATMPGEAQDFHAETFDGRPVVVSVQPNIQVIMATPDGKMLVPQDWSWSPIGQADAVSLVGGEQDIGKEAAARRAYASVEIRAGGTDCFSIGGLAVDKLASAQREMVGLDDAMFLLAGLGVDQAYGVKKLGQAYSGREPVTVRIGRSIVPADTVKIAAYQKAAASNLPVLRRPLFKEAAFIPDPVAVDTVLSLGFINPENLMTFVSYLPEIEHAQQRMCELLMAARLGMREIPTSALEKSIRSTEEVLEGLKVLAFTE